MAGVASVGVGSERELETAISAYIAQGFVLSNRSSSGATMFKKKEFKIVWAVIGFFLCLLPLLIYLIVYASQKDQMVQINLSSSSQLELPAPQGYQYGQRSADGHWWWDGRAWQSIALPTESEQPTLPQRAPSSDWLPAPEAPAENPAEHPAEPGSVTPTQEAKPDPA